MTRFFAPLENETTTSLLIRKQHLNLGLAAKWPGTAGFVNFGVNTGSRSACLISSLVAMFSQSSFISASKTTLPELWVKNRQTKNKHTLRLKKRLLKIRSSLEAKIQMKKTLWTKLMAQKLRSLNYIVWFHRRQKASSTSFRFRTRKTSVKKLLSIPANKESLYRTKSKPDKNRKKLKKCSKMKLMKIYSSFLYLSLSSSISRKK